jgi:hypothetical protein
MHGFMDKSVGNKILSKMKSSIEIQIFPVWYQHWNKYYFIFFTENMSHQRAEEMSYNNSSSPLMLLPQHVSVLRPSSGSLQ